MPDRKGPTEPGAPWTQIHFSIELEDSLIELLKKELRTGAVRAKTMTWIRFRKDDELVELAFNSRMMYVYNLSNMDEIVNEMIAHMKGQIENPALLNSKIRIRRGPIHGC